MRSQALTELESYSDPFARTEDPVVSDTAFEESEDDRSSPWRAEADEETLEEGSEDEARDLEESEGGWPPTSEAEAGAFAGGQEYATEDAASPQGHVGPAQVTLRVAELIQMWDVATALNERIRRIVVQVLDQRTRTPGALSPPAISLVQSLVEEEIEGEDPQPVINGLIEKGLSENDITSEVFYQRNPKLRGRVLQAGTTQAQQWRSIRDSEVRPSAKRLLGSWIADPVLLATFFSQYEGDSRVPAKAAQQFLTRSPLQSMGKSLRDRILWQWRSGKPPVTLDRLYEMAYEVSGHSGSAFLLCHNVTKAFARGGVAITWDRVPTAPDTYSDGKKVWTPKVIHRAGKLIRNYSEKYKRELPSIYYLLFSEKEFGTDDAGDWYHYYVAATMTAYGAAGELSPSAPVRELEDRDPTTGRIGDVVAQAYPLLVRDRVLDLESQMSNPDFVDVPGYRGWVLANVLSFLEGGHYGEKQEDVARESRFHLRGALAGLRTAGIKPGKYWVWYVPGAKSISKQDLVHGFQLQYKMAGVLDASGQRFRRPAKGTK